MPDGGAADARRRFGDDKVFDLLGLEERLEDDDERLCEQVPLGLIFYQKTYTVRKGYRFSRPQPGGHYPNSPVQREFG